MLMRATGRGSISSFLKLAVDVAWVVACALLGFIWIIAAFSIYYLVTGDLLFPLFERVVVSTPRDLVVWSLNGSILCIGAMIVCAYLRGVFETLVARDPFVPENAKRFAAIGIVLAIMEGRDDAGQPAAGGIWPCRRQPAVCFSARELARLVRRTHPACARPGFP